MAKLISQEYVKLLNELKKKVQTSQMRASLTVNKELILLYWNIGKKIIENQNTAGWGAKIIDLLSKDLSNSFPDMKGFSVRNLKYMRSFAEVYSGNQFVQQVVAQIPWGHIVRLLDQVKSDKERRWYIEETIKHRWSRNVLIHQINLDLYNRQIKNKKIHNFKTTLPSSRSALAQQTLKDPYIFDFLSMEKKIKERELENGFISHITKLLLELGSGFAFVGRQVHLEIGSKDYYIDLLFYHLKLRSYIVIEIKTGDFKPEHAGKLNFYLSAVDDLLRHPDDKPSIGLLLCQKKEKITAEYALRNVHKPMGISEYKLANLISRKFKNELPAITDLEAKLNSRKIKVFQKKLDNSIGKHINKGKEHFMKSKTPKKKHPKKRE